MPVQIGCEFGVSSDLLVRTQAKYYYVFKWCVCVCCNGLVLKTIYWSRCRIRLRVLLETFAHDYYDGRERVVGRANLLFEAFPDYR